MVKWITDRVLGRGGSATVRLAVVSDDDDGGNTTLAAVKSAPLHRSAPLRREKSALDRLSAVASPRIVRCLGDAEAGGRYHLFLELAAGGSLSTALRRRAVCRLPPLPDRAVRRLARGVAEGLRDVHAAGFAHCDVKPGNVLLFGSPDDELQDCYVKIADFGLAKPVGEAAAGFRGTLIYASPEKVATGESETPGDVWALGCVVAEMASGRPPWSDRYSITSSTSLSEDECDNESENTNGNNDDDDKYWSVLERIAKEEPEIPAGMSEEGKDFLRRGCFERDPRRRWTAEMLLAHPFLSPPAGSDGSGECSLQLSLQLSPGGLISDWVSGSQEMLMEMDEDAAEDMEGI